jgi:hypothetical protein
MSKRFTSILLFVLVIYSYALSAPIVCNDSLNQSACVPPQSHPLTADLTTSAPMSCCQQMTSIHAKEIIIKGRACCRVSIPPLNQTGPALLVYSTVELKWNSILQVSPPTITPSLNAKSLSSSWPLAIAFCLDHSDTYLLSSTFRI